ncbi:MAG: F0F1 ATP synthase subunit B [Clostridiales bacterium]|nr:F0F1 ATP synthase subunit B [Clostridiales bacterium]
MLKFDFNLIFTIINLIIFFVLMRIFLFKPIKKVLDKRKELVDKQFSDADTAKQEAEMLKNEYQSQLDGVDEEKNQIIITARENAKKEYDTIIDRAQSDAEKIKSDARKTAQLETEKAKLAVKEEIAMLAIETAEKVVGEHVSAQTDSDLYDKFLKESSETE